MPILVALTFALLWAAAPSPARAQNHKPIAWRKPVEYSFAGMGIGYLFFLSIGVWDEDPSWENLENAFSEDPEWDPNPFYYNWVLHPLWGSETYLRAREGNFGIVGSFLFSSFCSFFWEYLLEGWMITLGAQDLIATSPIGSILGEARYQLKGRLSSGHDWWLDPIDTTLQHAGIWVRPEGDDDWAVGMVLSFDI